MWRVFLWLVAIGSPIAILVLAILNPPSQDEWWAPWVLAIGGSSLGFAGLLADEEVIIGSETIRQVGPLGRRRKITWLDVASLDFTSSGQITLVSACGTRIKITPDMVGVVELATFLEHRLPGSVLADCAIDLETYCKFVGAHSVRKALCQVNRQSAQRSK